jgi:hypothetical protein
MNKNLSDTSTATLTATRTKEQLSPSPALEPVAETRDQKLMVVAICRGRDGQMVITPIDVEHETDDLTPMTDEQLAARKRSDQPYNLTQEAMTKALGGLHEVFSRRLYRDQFRTFENYCFALYGTHRINDVFMKKVLLRCW